MDPNVVHRQFLPGYGDPATWSSILYNYGGQGPANQLHDLRAEQPRALPHDSQRQQITGHEIAEFFARTAAPPVTILNECHLQAQPQQAVSTPPHDVVLDLGLSAAVAPRKNDKVEPGFIQDSTERLKFDKRKLKNLKSTLAVWYKRSGCVTVSLTFLDGEVQICGPDHMLSLHGNEQFKNIFVNTLTSYEQLSRLAEIVSNCNEEEQVPDSLNTGTVSASEIANEAIPDNTTGQAAFVDFGQPSSKQQGKKGDDAVFDQDCKLCPQKFSSKHFLKKHMFEAHNQAAPLLVCPFCSKRFMTRWKLERHTISHTGAKPYNCIYCPKRFAEKNKLVVHVKNHKEGFVDPQAVERLVNSLLPKRKTTHDCIVCGKSFMSSWKLNRHIRVHSGEKPYKCSKCSKSFVEKSKLDQHELLPHDGTKVKPGAQEKRHECDKCDKKFVSLWKLKRHELFHSGERPWQCDRCGKGFVENNKLMLHIKFYHTDKETPDAVARRVSRSKKYECTDCDKKFATQWKLKRHSQTHSLDRPFRCGLCKRGFLTKNKLDLHNFTMHSEEGQEKQETKTDRRPSENSEEVMQQEQSSLPSGDRNKADSEPLMLPAMSIHTDTSQAYTEEFNKSFVPEHVQPRSAKVTLTVTDPSAINAGTEFDLTEGSFTKLAHDSKTCGECGKAFKTPSRLKRHMAVHTGVRPYKCTWCDKGFTERNKLLGHLKTHGVEGAELTLETIPSKVEAAEQHGGKHQCSFCDRSFVSPWKLKRHLTIHTGKRPFFCKICQRAFTEKNKLESHFRSNHPGDLTLLEEELSQVELTMVETESAFSIVARTMDESTVVKQEKIEHDEDYVISEADKEVELKCNVCSKPFASDEALRSHLKLTHSLDSPDEAQLTNDTGIPIDSKKALKYSCEVCGKSFITPSKLKRHSFSHGEQKPYKCKKCGKRFSENNKLFNHLITHDKARHGKLVTKIKLKMDTSGENNEETVLSIANVQPNESVTAIKGTMSGSASATADGAGDTERSHEFDGEDNRQRIEETGSLDARSYIPELNAHDHSEPSPDLPVIGTSRDISKSNSEQLKMLVENALASAASESEHSIRAKKSQNGHSMSNIESGGEGSRSQSVVVTSSAAANQLKKTTGTAGFCTQTSGPAASSAGKGQLLSGVKALASEVTQTRDVKVVSQLHSCDVCQQSFLSQFSLKQHKVVSHPEKLIENGKAAEDLRHRCPECNKGFKTPSKLKRHSLSHTGETPYHCHLCPKRFKRNDSLRKHLEEHNRGK